MSFRLRSMRLFVPLLAGARWSDRLIACLGALFGIAATAAASSLAPHPGSFPFLVAPMGASAVLLFAVPSSPMAQPWPIVGGSIVSALVGVTIARLIPDPQLALGLAVSLAILAMSALRCLHPPGGACAILPILASGHPASADYGFVLLPVGLNASLLVAMGLLFHRFSGHSYPHRPVPVAGHTVIATANGILPEDVDRALEELGETFDVAREDLDLLFRVAEKHALDRASASEPRA